MSATSTPLTSPQKLAVNVLSAFGQFRNRSLGKFSEDTAISMGSRLAASRGKKENSEIVFVELFESLLAYFVPGLLANKVLGPLFHKIGNFNNPKLLTHSLQDLFKEGGKQGSKLVQKALPHRLAILLGSVVFTAVCGEYILLFLKNLMTLNLHKTASFNDVANLGSLNKNDQQQIILQQEAEAIRNKAHRRIKQLLGVGAGILLLSGLIVRIPALKNMVGKLASSYRLNAKGQANNLITKIINALDFDYKVGKAAMKFPAHLAIYMGISFLGYLDSARNKLERQEVATRLPLIMGYLLFGQQLISKLLNKTIFKNPKIHETSIKTLIEQLTASSGKRSVSTLLKQQKILPQRLLATILPYIIGGGLVSFGIATISKLMTKYRYNQTVKDKTINQLQIKNFMQLRKNNANQALQHQSALFQGLKNQQKFQQGNLSTKQEANNGEQTHHS